MKVDEEFFKGTIGDKTALSDINRELYKQYPAVDVRCSWNADWVDKVAAMEGQARVDEIARGVALALHYVKDVEEQNDTVRLIPFFPDRMPITKQVQELLDFVDSIPSKELWGREQEMRDRYRELVDAYYRNGPRSNISADGQGLVS